MVEIVHDFLYGSLLGGIPTCPPPSFDVRSRAANAAMLLIARQLADRGHPVFVADLWGERRVPTTESEAGPLIGHLVSHREHSQKDLHA